MSPPTQLCSLMGPEASVFLAGLEVGEWQGAPSQILLTVGARRLGLPAVIVVLPIFPGNLVQDMQEGDGFGCNL